VLRQARPAPAVAQRVADYVAAAKPRAQRPVGRIGGAFERTARTDGSAGRLVADAQWQATRSPPLGGADFALMNPGGMRTDLRCPAAPPCDVTYGEVFAMQPFGNNLVVMTLSGAEIRQMLEDQQRPGRAQPHFLIPSSSMTYDWHARASHGSRVQNLRIGGASVDPARDYRLTVNSFMADGGDGVGTLVKGRQRVGGILDLDALVTHLLATNPSPDPVPRVRWVD
jgi:5'-nucleotidase